MWPRAGSIAGVSTKTEAGGDVIGVDWRQGLDEAWATIGHDRGIQGNLDPIRLFGPREGLIAAADDVLRRAAGKDAARLRREVADKICRKIAWAEPVPDAEVEQFLRDFYAAERAFLEREQLYGRPKASKEDTGKPAVGG